MGFSFWMGLFLPEGVGWGAGMSQTWKSAPYLCRIAKDIGATNAKCIREMRMWLRGSRESEKILPAARLWRLLTLLKQSWNRSAAVSVPVANVAQVANVANLSG